MWLMNPKFKFNNIITVLIFVVFIINFTTAKSIQVKSASEITNALKNVVPGDTLVMKNGVWTDQKIVFSGTGTETNNIYLVAETPGKVLLNGTSTLRIQGKYLTVDGLYFYGGYSSSGAVIEFRSSSNAENCRLTNTSIVDYNPSDKTKDYKWISLYGKNNRVDHCYVYGKNHSGTTLVVWLDKSTVPNNHKIDYNYFGYRPALGVNGGETIRVGDSNTSIYTSSTIVENNYFERCNGEIEIISNKSDGNIYRYNTFVECEGGLTLRHGDNCEVYNNFFFGNNKPLTSGVRLIGAGHQVYNNYFQDLAGSADDWRGAIVMMNGIPNSPLNGYFQVDSCKVLFNTIVNCTNSFLIGSKKTEDPTQTLVPKNCIIANNIVLSNTSAFTIASPPEQFSYEGNIISAPNLGITKPDGILLENPKLKISTDGLFRLESSSPAIGAAKGIYPYVQIDMDGQNRGANKDVGADQLSDAPVLLTPRQKNEVGPTWKINGNLVILSVQKTGSGNVVLEPDGGIYDVGTIVKITAQPGVNGSFIGWSGDTVSTINPLTIIMNKNKTITAGFKDPVYYKLSYWRTGNGNVILDPAGGNYLEGTKVSITAVPDTGWRFDSWGGVLSGSANPEIIEMNANKVVLVNFSVLTSMIENTLPTNFSLEQNYPNPFNPATKISYQLLSDSVVNLRIFDILGKELATLVSGHKSAGKHSVLFNSGNLDLPSGIYFYRLSAANPGSNSPVFVQTKKMILQK